MTPSKLPPGLTPIEALMGKTKIDQQALRAAIRQQRTPKPQTFPVGNRAARRMAKSKKGERPL